MSKKTLTTWQEEKEKKVDEIFQEKRLTFLRVDETHQSIHQEMCIRHSTNTKRDN